MFFEELEGLCCQKVFDGEYLGRIVDNLEQLEGRTGTETKVVFLQGRRHKVIDHCRLCEVSVFSDQGSRDILRDHHSRVHPGQADQERRQPTNERIDQTIQTALCNPGKLCNCDTQQVGSHRHGFSVWVGLRQNAIVVRCSDNKWIVSRRSQFDIDLLFGVSQLVTTGPMNLGDRANTQGILGANAATVGNDFTACQQRAQSGTNELSTRMGFQCEDGLIKRIDLPFECLETHRTDDVRPVGQIERISQPQTCQAGHAGRAVYQTDPVFGGQFQFSHARLIQRLFRWHQPPLPANLAKAQQRDTNVRHVSQIADRAL